MTEQNPAAEQPAPKVESRVLDAAAVLTGTLNNEKARKSSDLGLLELLESTILRIDAPDNAWDKAAAAISKLASSRAESRMKTL